MSDNEDNSQAATSTTYGAIGLLALHNPVAAHPNESEQPEPEPNEITTNIIKDASKVANQENGDFDDEDIQRKMNGLIDDLQSETVITEDKHFQPRKSITSGHLIDNQDNSSTPAIIDSSSNNPPQVPIRSISESALIDHHASTEFPSTLPIQQNESSTDEDDSTINNTNRTFDDSQQPLNTNKQNAFDETTRFGTTPRIESSLSKRSRSISGDEKRAQLPDETGTDTDRDNQEVTNISRRSSHSKSPLNRPRAPSPDDSPKTPTNVESKRPHSSSLNEQKQNFQPPTAVISPASRRESTNKTDQQPTSRPSSTIKSKFNDNLLESSTNQSNNDFLTTNYQSKLIKPGEQLQIPSNDIDNERINSPPPSPVTKQTVLKHPLLENNHTKTEQDHSRPPSERNRNSPISSSVSNTKVIDGDAVSSKSRRSSNANQQQTTATDQKPPSASNPKKSNVSENDQKEPTKNKTDSRHSSPDADLSLRTSAKQKQERILSNDKRQSSLRNRSGQKSKTNSNTTTTDQTIITPIKIDSAKSRQQNEKRLSTTDSDNERLNNSKLPHVNSSSQRTTPTGDKQTISWTKQAHIPPLQTTDDESPTARPQSPNVEQITERNQHSSTNKKRKTDEHKKKEPNRSLRRSNSAESSGHIPIVDDKSLDSTSGNNTEAENSKQRRVKSKKKDVETNTDSRNGNHQQQQELTSQKPLKATKPMSDHSPSIRRRIPTKEQYLTTPDTEPDSNRHVIRRSIKKSKDSTENKDPFNVNVTVLVKNMKNEDDGETLKKPKQKTLISKIDSERHTQSDTEQIISEKQKKRRRPKRISRTTQTYECVFRRMEYEEHEELRPTSETEKNIQTRKSRLRPRTRSPKRHYPIYLSTNAFKIEEILPKQFPQAQRNVSKTSVVARSTSPPGGKLLILRPTLPFHHTDAVNVQRISLQYAIDLVPNEHKSNDTTHGQQSKSNSFKHSEQTNNLPIIRSPTSPANISTNKINTKDKSIPNRNEDRTYQRKNGGNV